MSSKRQDPAARVIAYCETAPVDEVRAVLAIGKAVLAKRLPPTRAPRPAPRAVAAEKKTPPTA